MFLDIRAWRADARREAQGRPLTRKAIDSRLVLGRASTCPERPGTGGGTSARRNFPRSRCSARSAVGLEQLMLSLCQRQRSSQGHHPLAAAREAGSKALELLIWTLKNVDRSPLHRRRLGDGWPVRGPADRQHRDRTARIRKYVDPGRQEATGRRVQVGHRQQRKVLTQTVRRQHAGLGPLPNPGMEESASRRPSLPEGGRSRRRPACASGQGAREIRPTRS